MAVEPFYQGEADRLTARINTKRGIARSSASISSDHTATAKSAAPLLHREPAQGRRSSPPGARLGQAARTGFSRTANAAIGRAEAGANALTAVPRVIAGFSRDFSRALAGQGMAADAGQTLPPFKLPRLSRSPGPSVGSGAAESSAPATPVSPGSPSPVIRTPLTQLPAGPASGSANTFTFSDGRTVPVASSPTEAPVGPRQLRQAPVTDTTPEAPAATLEPQVLARATAADQRDLALQVRGDVASNLMPGSTGDELVRRLQHSQGSYFSRGSPSARAAAAEAYGGQLAALSRASGDYQQGANCAFRVGLEGAVSSGLAEQAVAGQARLQCQATDSAIQLGQAAEDGPVVLRDAADGVVRLRRGARAQAVTDEDGKPVQDARPPVAGSLTPQVLLKAYTEQRGTIQGSLATADEKAAALAELDASPLFAPLRLAPSPSWPEFLVKARVANPSVPEQELRYHFDANYGGR